MLELEGRLRVAKAAHPDIEGRDGVQGNIHDWLTGGRPSKALAEYARRSGIDEREAP